MRYWRRLICLLSLFVVGVAWAAPSDAHLAVQLFQGAESYETGVIRALPPHFRLDAFPRLKNGLYQMPPQFKLEIELLSGVHRGQRVSVDHILYGNPSVDVVPAVGERVIVTQSKLANGSWLYQVTDYDRRPALWGTTLVTLLVVILMGRGFGLKTLLLAFAGMAALFAVVLPAMLRGQSPLVLVGLAASVLSVVSARTLLLKGTPESLGALLGALIGVAVTVSGLSAAYAWGHISGLATPDALVLYAQVNDARQLDYRQIWTAGALITALGGLLAMSVLTARAIARQPDQDPWKTGLQEHRSLMPMLGLGTGLLYFGLSLPLLLISHLGAVTDVHVSVVRLVNFDYLASVVLAWEVGVIGLVASGVGTAWAVGTLRRRGARAS